MRPLDLGGDRPAPRAGRLLVAAPGLVDPNFFRTVVLLLGVDEEGALGVVLNRPGEVAVDEVLEGWGGRVGEPSVLFRGGPVATDTALGVATLPDPEQGADLDTPVGWRPLFDRCGLVDLDCPSELIAAGLQSLRIYAGYAGWESGQLDVEIEEGAWYVVPGQPGDACTRAVGDLWRRVLARQPRPLAWMATCPDDPTWN